MYKCRATSNGYQWSIQVIIIKQTAKSLSLHSWTDVKVSIRFLLKVYCRCLLTLYIDIKHFLWWSVLCGISLRCYSVHSVTRVVITWNSLNVSNWKDFTIIYEFWLTLTCPPNKYRIWICINSRGNLQITPFCNVAIWYFWDDWFDYNDKFGKYLELWTLFLWNGNEIMVTKKTSFFNSKKTFQNRTYNFLHLYRLSI